MASNEELEQQIEELRAMLDAVAKGGELKMKSHGFHIGNLRVFQKEAAVGDDRLYQEEQDGTVTDLTEIRYEIYLPLGDEPLVGQTYVP